jgi:DNA-binding transcriptional regulator YdaS (Cro superfamily)
MIRPAMKTRTPQMNDRTPQTKALRRAVVICGSQVALAKAVGRGLAQSNVSMWFTRENIPAEHCPTIERVTRGLVKCEQLRPDVEWAVISKRQKTAAKRQKR